MPTTKPLAEPEGVEVGVVGELGVVGVVGLVGVVDVVVVVGVEEAAGVAAALVATSALASVAAEGVDGAAADEDKDIGGVDGTLAGFKLLAAIQPAFNLFCNIIGQVPCGVLAGFHDGRQ